MSRKSYFSACFLCMSLLAAAVLVHGADTRLPGVAVDPAFGARIMGGDSRCGDKDLASTKTTYCGSSTYSTCGGGNCGTMKYSDLATIYGLYAAKSDGVCSTKMCSATGGSVNCGTTTRPNCGRA